MFGSWYIFLCQQIHTNIFQHHRNNCCSLLWIRCLLWIP
jgi:hypothetical protein